MAGVGRKDGAERMNGSYRKMRFKTGEKFYSATIPPREGKALVPFRISFENAWLR
jgi:hypothetical protein